MTTESITFTIFPCDCMSFQNVNGKGYTWLQSCLQRERWFTYCPERCLKIHTQAERLPTTLVEFFFFPKIPICRANGFLVFPGDAIPPFINAFIRRWSEDEAENVVPVPPFRPVNCIPSKCRGKYESSLSSPKWKCKSIVIPTAETVENALRLTQD